MEIFTSMFNLNSKVYEMDIGFKAKNYTFSKFWPSDPVNVLF